MRILALDLATVTGFAFGDAGTIPTSGSVRLKRTSEPVELAPRNLACFLSDRFVTFDGDLPDLVVIESLMDPSAMKGGAAIALAHRLSGVVDGVFAPHGVRMEFVGAITWRKHFCGRASAGPARRRGDPPRTDKQRAAIRAETKKMTINRAIATRYIPRGCSDDNRADACGIFDFASATWGRKAPAGFSLFGAPEPAAMAFRPNNFGDVEDIPE